MNESGDLPSHDELLDKAVSLYCKAWADGIRLDPEEFCVEHATCGPELRQRLDHFLYAAEGLRAGSTDHPEDRPEKGGEQATEPGKRLGDFRLIREIGRGGMGVVFEAEQVSLARRVALKVLPPHLTLRPESVERFKREASTASRLRHPGIVEIYSVGEEADTHYFAMEMVEGTPLNRIIGKLRDEESFPSTGESLTGASRDGSIQHDEPVKTKDQDPPSGKKTGFFKKNTFIESVCRLVSQVADALDHAHRAGVIHRDVKPSNIILRSNGSAVLTDFGLAREEGLSSLTMTGEFAGTPHYVSPEQAMTRRKEVDHRTDIYSLGATLYELLTLRRPFDGKSSQEILGKIIAKDPPALRKLNPLIPRDLETICLAAMEKSPGRRYQTAKEMADDIERFLKFEPVQARPVGIVTRTLRVVRRNPAFSALVALICVVVIGGPLIFGIQQQVAKNRISKALSRAREDAEKARIEAERSRQVCEFVINIFEISSPEVARGRMISVAEILKRAEAALNIYLGDQPEIQVLFQEAIGRLYTGLGLYAEAEPLLEKAREHYHRELGQKHINSIRSDYYLGHIYYLNGKLDEAEQTLNHALDESRRHLGGEDKITLAIMTDRAHLFRAKGQTEDAMRILLQVREIQERTLGPDAPELFETIANLSRLNRPGGNFAYGESLAREAYEGRKRVLGVDHPRTLDSMRDLAIFFAKFDRFDEIGPLYRESFELHDQVLGPNHPNTLMSELHLAFYLVSKKRYDEAAPHYTHVLEGRREVLGEDHPRTILTITFLGTFRHTEGKIDEAEELFKQAVDAAVEHLGYELNSTSIALVRMARFFEMQGRLDEAESFLLEHIEKSPPDSVSHDELEKQLKRLAAESEKQEN